MFGPGYHKDTLYTPAMIQRMADLFKQLSADGGGQVRQAFRVKAKYVPKGKMGHSFEQRLTKSLGLPNTGRIIDARVVDGGNLQIDVVGVPLWLGAMINAGMIDDGSIEVAPRIPDPADPSDEIEGPILTGVAFLGEEPPAVKGFPPPQATFPPDVDIPPPEAPDWYRDLASGPGDGASETDGTDFLSQHADRLARTVIRFSEMCSMNRDQMIAALAAKGIDAKADPKLAAASDADLQELLNSAGQGFSSAAKCYAAKFGEKAPEGATGAGAAPKKDEEAPAWFSAHIQKYNADRAEDQKRLGAVEQYAANAQKATGDQEDAMMSERVKGIVSEAINANRLARRHRGMAESEGMTVAKTKTYGAVTGNYEQALQSWKHTLMTAPLIGNQDPIPDNSGGKKTDPRLENPYVAATMRPNGALDQMFPAVAKRLREAAATAN